jgi:hypothetical protein
LCYFNNEFFIEEGLGFDLFIFPQSFQRDYDCEYTSVLEVHVGQSTLGNDFTELCIGSRAKREAISSDLMVKFQEI